MANSLPDTRIRQTRSATSNPQARSDRHAADGAIGSEEVSGSRNGRAGSTRRDHQDAEHLKDPQKRPYPPYNLRSGATSQAGHVPHLAESCVGSSCRGTVKPPSIVPTKLVCGPIGRWQPLNLSNASRWEGRVRQSKDLGRGMHRTQYRILLECDDRGIATGLAIRLYPGRTSLRRPPANQRLLRR